MAHMTKLQASMAAKEAIAKITKALKASWPSEGHPLGASNQESWGREDYLSKFAWPYGGPQAQS